MKAVDTLILYTAMSVYLTLAKFGQSQVWEQVAFPPAHDLYGDRTRLC